jgi:hypothetical protein
MLFLYFVVLLWSDTNGGKPMSKYRLPTMPLSDAQKNWLESECEKTQQTKAAVIRQLIEEKMKKGRK